MNSRHCIMCERLSSIFYAHFLSYLPLRGMELNGVFSAVNVVLLLLPTIFGVFFFFGHRCSLLL
jgi:hypothetical protein